MKFKVTQCTQSLLTHTLSLHIT